MMYEPEGAVIYDAKRLSRMCGSTPAAFKKAVDGLVATGKSTLSDGFLSNSGVEIEIEKRSEKRAAASASANARWEKTNKKQCSENATALKTQCDRNANQNPEPEEKEEPDGSSKKRASRLPCDWRLPRDWSEWAMNEGLSEICVRREAERFRDYWHSASGRQATKLDWQAVWRNWVRRAVDNRPAARAAGGPPSFGTKRTLSDGRVQEYAGNGVGWDLCS